MINVVLTYQQTRRRTACGQTGNVRISEGQCGGKVFLIHNLSNRFAWSEHGKINFYQSVGKQ